MARLGSKPGQKATTKDKAKQAKAKQDRAKAKRRTVMPDFLAQELVNQRLDQVERSAHEGAQRHAWLREALAERRARRSQHGR
jgi:hypothetical protein